MRVSRAWERGCTAWLNLCLLLCSLGQCRCSETIQAWLGPLQENLRSFRAHCFQAYCHTCLTLSICYMKLIWLNRLAIRPQKCIEEVRSALGNQRLEWYQVILKCVSFAKFDTILQKHGTIMSLIDPVSVYPTVIWTLIVPKIRFNV